MLVKNNEENIYEGFKEMILNKVLREHFSHKAIIRSDMFDVKNTMDHIYDALTFNF